jgi:CDP-diacylglycerol--serine O-phosphatidyltransferase
VPNLATASNMMLGMGAVWCGLRGQVEMAGWLIVWAAFLDGLDGVLARLLDAKSHFGIEFDSLADHVSFGLAPAALLASYADRLGIGVWDGSPHGWIVLVPVTFYVVMAGVRLARFNVQTLELGEMLFRGIPTTMSAGIISVLVLTLIKHGDPVAGRDPVLLLVGTVATVFGLLMVSNLPLPKFRKRRMRLYGMIESVLAGILIILGFMRRMPEVLLAAGSIYTIGGVIVGKRFEKSYYLEQERRLNMAQEAEMALARLSEVDEEEDEQEGEEGTISSLP